MSWVLKEMEDSAQALLFDEIKKPLLGALEVLSPHFREIDSDWKDLLGNFVLAENEVAALSDLVLPAEAPSLPLPTHADSPSHRDETLGRPRPTLVRHFDSGDVGCVVFASLGARRCARGRPGPIADCFHRRNRGSRPGRAAAWNDGARRRVG